MTKPNRIEKDQAIESREQQEFLNIVTNAYNAAQIETDKIWGAEILYGKNRETHFKSNVIKLTFKPNSQSLNIPYEDFCDEDSLQVIMKKMRMIGGVVEPSYVKALIKKVNKVIIEQRDQLISVKDLTLHLPQELGKLSVTQYVAVISDHIKENPHLFPKQSSKTFNFEEHDGAILENVEKREEGEVVIGFIAPKLRELLKENNSNKFHKILEGLARMGVLEGRPGSKDNFRKEKTLADGVKPKVYVIHLKPSILKEAA